MYLSTCSPAVLILVLDSQYNSLVLASTPDFVLAHSTKFVRLTFLGLTTCCLIQRARFSL
jgi:hypothetical protein